MSSFFQNPPEMQLGLSAADYRALGGVSYSSLKLLVSRTPAHFLEAVNNPPPPTPSMLLGSAMHALLSGETVSEMPVCSASTKGGGGCKNPALGKFSREGQPEAEFLCGVHSRGLEAAPLDGLFVPADVLADAQKMKEAAERELFGKPSIILDGLFHVGDEVSLHTKTHDGTIVRCRLDALWASEPETGYAPVIIDYKSVADASPKAFEKICAELRYDMQAALYTKMVEDYFANRSNGWGLSSPRFYFVLVENAAPWATCVCELGAEDLLRAWGSVSDALEIFSLCSSRCLFPASYGTHRVEVPKWARGGR